MPGIRTPWITIAALAVCLTATAALASDISSTKHNLSVSGPGTVKASTETRVCIFCHTPHSASSSAQLWNRNESSAGYTPYSTTTLNASPGAPTGSSRLCLSCHDGEVALGEVISESGDISMTSGITEMPAGSTNLGVSLMDDHPVSFQFTSALAVADGQLIDPATLSGAVQLDDNSEIQCMTCHDPHDDTYGSFLVMDNTSPGICEECHVMSGWSGASHETPGVSIISDNDCQGCHTPHNAGDSQRILRDGLEEEVCYGCHNASETIQDIESEFAKTYAHPVTTNSGVHDPTEAALVGTRHVECADCHNPHELNDSFSTAPNVSGPLTGVQGIDTDGNAVTQVTYSYEICYRCHADSAGKPGPASPRFDVQDNVRLEFDPTNPSYHPIEAAGASTNMPSLIGPLTSASIIYCTDCHNNDTGTTAGGSDPDGPHGSSYDNLLGWNYYTGVDVAESATLYELCYRCHDRNSIRMNQSFRNHNRHIRVAQESCNICHDPHGSTENEHLINFDLTYVSGVFGVGDPVYIDDGFESGVCTLRCHGRDHNNRTY
jgi:predicted CXXCH cytochrome family protein